MKAIKLFFIISIFPLPATFQCFTGPNQWCTFARLCHSAPEGLPHPRRLFTPEQRGTLPWISAGDRRHPNILSTAAGGNHRQLGRAASQGSGKVLSFPCCPMPICCYWKVWKIPKYFWSVSLLFPRCKPPDLVGTVNKPHSYRERGILNPRCTLALIYSVKTLWCGVWIYCSSKLSLLAFMPQVMLLCFSEFLWTYNLPGNPFCFSVELVFSWLISLAWLSGVKTPRAATWSRRYGNSTGEQLRSAKPPWTFPTSAMPPWAPKELSTIYFLWAQGCSALLGGKPSPLGWHGTKMTADWQQQLKFALWNTQSIFIKGLCICRNHEA